MHHRTPREDALEDSAASLRMANGLLRDLVEAGVVDGDPDDFATLLAVTRDEIVRMSVDLSDADSNAGSESSPSTLRDGEPHDAAEAERVLRLTEKRLEALARLIEQAIDEPFLIE